MLRFRILISIVPLMTVAFIARIELVSAAQRRISVGNEALQTVSVAFGAVPHVSFADNPTAAAINS
jgi:phospholipid N-methyltransferase